MMSLYIQDYGTYWPKDSVRNILKTPVTDHYVYHRMHRNVVHEFTGTESQIRHKLMQIDPAYGLKV